MINREKKERVYSVFETIAQRYDSANNRISFGMQKRWKKLLIRRVLKTAGPGMKVLDVCCGAILPLPWQAEGLTSRSPAWTFHPPCWRWHRIKAKGLKTCTGCREMLLSSLFPMECLRRPVSPSDFATQPDTAVFWRKCTESRRREAECSAWTPLCRITRWSYLPTGFTSGI